MFVHKCLQSRIVMQRTKAEARLIVDKLKWNAQHKSRKLFNKQNKYTMKNIRNTYYNNDAALPAKVRYMVIDNSNTVCRIYS